jgi:hypothetical protein
MMSVDPHCRKSARWNGFFGLLLIPVLFLAGCAAPEQLVAPTETSFPSITPTADPCAPAALPGMVDQVDDLLREFDDTTYVANMTPQAQLGEMILRLQEIRRRLEDIELPTCTQTLQTLGVEYMNSVIIYLGLFMSGGDRNQVADTISASQSLRSQYLAEYDRLLTSSGSAPASVTADQPVEPTQPAVVMNEENQTLNLRSLPALDSAIVGSLLPGETLPVLGRTEDGSWLLVQSEDQQLWVFASVISLSVPMESLAVVAPTPTPTRTATTAVPPTETSTITPTP